MLVEGARSAAWLVLSALSALLRMPFSPLMAAPCPAGAAGRHLVPGGSRCRRSQAQSREAWAFRLVLRGATGAAATSVASPGPSFAQVGSSVGSADRLQPFQIALRQ